MKTFFDLPVARSVNIPYEAVPHEPERFLAHASRLHIAKKYWHKRLLLQINGQLPLERKKLDLTQRVLWLYTGKRNFGDATMDLSGRALLRARGAHLDLLTLPHLHPLFAEDDVFTRVFRDVSEIDPDDYDAILMSEYNLPSIRLKTAHFRRLPYACLFQYFYGPDRNQTQFSHAAINDVFSLGHTPAEIAALSKPYLASDTSTPDAVRALIPTGRFIALSVGGMDANRTYRLWPEVLDRLDAQAEVALDDAADTIVLLGSDNGAEMARALVQRAYRRLEVRSCVGRLSLLQSREIIAHAALFVGCDGGLMHVAHSTATPSVSLFSNREPPYLRLTRRCQSLGLASPGDVDAIRPETIVEAIGTQLRAPRAD
jgi:hypothetical protein